jgi:hypothetical protein
MVEGSRYLSAVLTIAALESLEVLSAFRITATAAILPRSRINDPTAFGILEDMQRWCI